MENNETGGVVFIDKPYGITSHYTSEIVKKILNAKKAGHTGTLDPKVTGLLIVLVNKATRLAWLLGLDKSYVGIGKLHKDVSLKKLRENAKNFVGKIEQLPPRRSRVVRKIRQREVYEFKILEKKGKLFLFRVKCQAGTYVRKLIHDFGQSIGGAHMLELRRIAIGPFKEDLAITLYELQKKKEIIPIEKVFVKLYQKINLSKKEAKRFSNGAPIYIKKKRIKKLNEQFILIFYKKNIIGVGKIFDNQIKPKIVLAKV